MPFRRCDKEQFSTFRNANYFVQQMSRVNLLATHDWPNYTILLSNRMATILKGIIPAFDSLSEVAIRLMAYSMELIGTLERTFVYKNHMVQGNLHGTI